jgi:ketosteroid isomerase-like protein
MSEDHGGLLEADINLPDVLREAQAAFESYEQALRANDLARLDDFFWRDPRVVRYGVADIQHGFDAVQAWRRSAPYIGPERVALRTVITTFGHDFATAMTEFRNTPSAPLGRQMQTWVRGPEGWRIVAAHVSFMPAA